MFILQEEVIDVSKAKNSVKNSLNGALVTFEGIVRPDKKVTLEVSSLLYIVDREECILIGEQIVREALGAFPINHAVCIQRFGQVNVGETATWIGVWSPHRDEAFKGCRYIIEEIKKRLLIWKKECYSNGSNKWIHGAGTPIIL
jgi:molybdopterin synthase catalytic subunit